VAQSGKCCLAGISKKECDGGFMACLITAPGVGAASTGLRVLVVDDNEYYVEAVSRLLATFPCVRAVDQALSSAEALAGMDAGPPDLMLVDITMPDMNGLDLTRVIKAMPNAPRVIIVTLYDTPAYKEAARTAGADGFAGKSNLGEDLRGLIARLFPEVCSGFP
jgi:DNA-binding NarL/FixJ family response regulator